MYTFTPNTIIGHRGCDKFPFNNTVESFLKALELGADMVEFDIRKTRDGVLIIHHDKDVFGHVIKENTCDALKKIAYEHYLRLPTLEETLQALRGKTHLDVELKEPGYEKAVVQLVLRYFSSSKFIMKSFHDESVLAIKEHYPDITAGLLIGTNDDLSYDSHHKNRGVRILKRKYDELFPWKRIEASKADFVSPDRRLLMLGLLRKAHRKNFPVLVWTINDKKTMASLMKTHMVSGIITDKPELASGLR